jgi:hypothetical protein
MRYLAKSQQGWGLRYFDGKAERKLPWVKQWGNCDKAEQLPENGIAHQNGNQKKTSMNFFYPTKHNNGNWRKDCNL